MNYNSLMNKPTINYRELIGDNTVTEVGGITEEQFNTLLSTDLSSYYTKAQIDDLFSRSYVYREKSGSIVTFDCPASLNGIDKVVSEIVAVQSGTGDPSPTNVRPITGWSAVNVYDTGKNLFAPPSTLTSGFNFYHYKVGEGTFTLSTTTPLSGSSNRPNVFLMTGKTTSDPSVGSDGCSDGQPRTKTSTDGYVTVAMRNVNNCNPLDYITQLEIGDTATTYEPFNGTTYTTTLKDGQGNPITCYGGELSNENGVQSLTNARAYVKGGWTQYASSNGYKAWRKDIPNPKGSNLLCNPMSNMISEYGSFSSSSMNKNILQINATSGVSEVTAYMALQEDVSADDVEICYEIATPQTIPQDNLAIASQDGTNNIWCDSGDITVKALDKIIQE